MKRFNCLNAQVPASKIPRSNSRTASVIPRAPGNHPELGRLSKAPAIRSIRFKRTTPGVAGRLLLAQVSTPVVDSSHPLGGVPARQLWRVVPQYQCPLFTAHVYPVAVLNRFENPQFFKQIKGRGISRELDEALDNQARHKGRTLYAKKGPEDVSADAELHVSSGDRRRAMRTLPMSLIIAVSKKTLHKSAVIRTKVKMRLKEALSLVAIRGATLGTDAGASAAEKEIVLSTPEGIKRDDISDALILQGWTYVIRPTLEIYRYPWPSLLKTVSEALITLKSQARKLEKKWGAENRIRRPEEAKRGPKTATVPRDPWSSDAPKAAKSRSSSISHVSNPREPLSHRGPVFQPRRPPHLRKTDSK